MSRNFTDFTDSLSGVSWFSKSVEILLVGLLMFSILVVLHFSALGDVTCCTYTVLCLLGLDEGTSSKISPEKVMKFWAAVDLEPSLFCSVNATQIGSPRQGRTQGFFWGMGWGLPGCSSPQIEIKKNCRYDYIKLLCELRFSQNHPQKSADV